MEYIAHSVEELSVIAQGILDKLPAGTALLLSGELGSGKTTFTKALAQLLGVTTAVTSPTFTIVGEYVTDHPTIKRLIHVDLYRLADNQAAQDPGVKEVLEHIGQPDILVVIEWPEKLGQYQPQPTQLIQFQVGDKPTERVVRVN